MIFNAFEGEKAKEKEKIFNAFENRKRQRNQEYASSLHRQIGVVENCRRFRYLRIATRTCFDGMLRLSNMDECSEKFGRVGGSFQFLEFQIL